VLDSVVDVEVVDPVLAGGCVDLHVLNIVSRNVRSRRSDRAPNAARTESPAATELAWMWD
jgi:hypothetical protein